MQEVRNSSMDKIAVITGANSGIGKSAAFQFADHGYRVIMACRNRKKSMPVCEEIRRKTGNRKVEWMQLDISSKESVRAFCEEYRKKYDVLDILIHNAAHFKHGEKNYQPSKDGMELTFSTNLLGPVLMTRLLSGVLARSEDARVLNSCSTNIKHFFDERRRIDFPSLCGKAVDGKRYHSYHLYGDSKIGLLMATHAMAKEYHDMGICVNAIMIPATKLSKETIKKFQSYWRLFAILQKPFVPKAEVIGNAYFSICTSEKFAGVTGKLLNHRGQIVRRADTSTPFYKIILSSQVYPPYVDDEETAKKVWKVCKEYT